MKLIDAEQLRTELKMLRRRYGYNELWDLSCYQAELGLARVGLIDEILSLLNTLEETSDNWKPSEEQQEVDLEKEVRIYCGSSFRFNYDELNDSFYSNAFEFDDVVELARHFYELGKNSK